MSILRLKEQKAKEGSQQRTLPYLTDDGALRPRNEQVLAREGERGGIDVVIEFPETVDEEEQHEKRKWKLCTRLGLQGEEKIKKGRKGEG